MKAIWNGEFLKIRRKALGLTTLQLSEKVGCTRPLISMWEKDKSSPTGYFLVLLGLALNVHPNEFYRIENEGVQKESLL